MDFSDEAPCPFDDLGGADTPPPTPPKSPSGRSPSQLASAAKAEPEVPAQLPSTETLVAPPPPPPPPPPSMPIHQPHSPTIAQPSLMDANPFGAEDDYDPFADPAAETAMPWTEQTTVVSAPPPPPPPPPVFHQIPTGTHQPSEPSLPTHGSREFLSSSQVRQPSVMEANPFEADSGEDPFAIPAAQEEIPQPPPPVAYYSQPPQQQHPYTAPAPPVPSYHPPGPQWNAAPPIRPEAAPSFDRHDPAPNPEPSYGFQGSSTVSSPNAIQPKTVPFPSQTPSPQTVPARFPPPLETGGLRYGEASFPRQGSSNNISSPATGTVNPRPVAFVPYKPTAAPNALLGPGMGLPTPSHSRQPSGQGMNPSSSSEFGFGMQRHSTQSEFSYRPPRHSLTCFSFGGGFFAAKGNKLVQTSVAKITSASRCDYVEEIKSIPGPIEPSTKPDLVLRALECIPQSPLRDLLQFIAQRPFDWSKDLPSLASIVSKSEVPSPFSDAYPFVPPEFIPAALGEIQSFVLAGDLQEAMRCALHYKQFDHALLIAMMCGKEAYEDVVQKMVTETMSRSAPLANAYRVFSGIPSNKEDPTIWEPQVKLLLVNDTPATVEELLSWGDALLNADLVDHAHFCYVTAQLKPLPKNPPKQIVDAFKGKFLLLGGVHRRDRCRTSLLTPFNVFRTEVLEYSRQKEHQSYVRQSLLPFRLALGLMCYELGFVEKGNAYMDCLSKIVPSSTQKVKGDHLARTLPQAILEWKTMLAARRPGESHSSGMKWWPFGGGSSASMATTATAPSTTSAKQTKPAPPASTSTSQAAPPQESAGKAPSQGESKAEKEKDSDASQKEKKGWFSSWRKPKKEEQVKVMQLDSDPVEVDETGRYKFEKTEEERRVEAQIKAGPPKLPGFVPSGAPPPAPSMAGPLPTSNPPMMFHPGAGAGMPPAPPQQSHLQWGAAPTASGPPPPMPPPGGALPVQQRYVDMFNS